ncbi:hypothetical protein M9Y10_017803 [Tritrichomonas musculus]|uniref:Nucleoplasmin-like domain-containing protein n=1 Tax=Tritrichomonas musculus TaxID=1915356 RepID=A0ABR2GMF1_9EUKA
MDVNISSFTSVVVKPDETVRVTVPSSLWLITSVSLAITGDLPEEGRVVLYASPVDEKGEYDKQIAIAPLRIGSCEVINVDYEINSATPMVFFTKGAKLSVSINGHTTTPEPLKIEILN